MSQTEILRFYSRSRLWTKTSRDDVVALFLTSEISRRELERGDRFPVSERDIAKALGVSRTSVNDAWRQLASEGIVKFKQGIGVFIVDPDRVRPNALKVYFKIREKAEMELARLAIENATRDDFQAMQDALDEQTKVVEELEQVGQAHPGSSARAARILRLFLSDLEFHAAVRKAAKDPWLEIISEVAEARTQAMRLASLSAPLRRPQEILDSHKEILETIRSQHEEDAVKAVEKHFEVARRLAEPVLDGKG